MDETEENLQLAENDSVDYDQSSCTAQYEEKRESLRKTKITKQTWSIKEIYEKLNTNKLLSETDYQRKSIWDIDKRTSFIESLFMEIIIPPIYVVEIPEDDILKGNSYEVVDGKQRLTTIREFLQDKFKLKDKSLEYYADVFGGKNFSEIKDADSGKVSQLLSYVLDIYVITANSPESTKYDIFARLNKGAEKLKVNEIRRAIYQSSVTKRIQKFVDEWTKETATEKTELYNSVFSPNDKKRFEDYGRFYRSIAFYLQSIHTGSAWTVKDYNSRPREMINTVLQKLQKHELSIDDDHIDSILEKTVILKDLLKDNPNKEYIIDSIIPFAINKWNVIENKLKDLIKTEEYIATFTISPATTTNVNTRLNYMANKLSEI